jgi:hypothetical protein
MTKKTNKIFENYFKQNLKEHGAAMSSSGRAGNQYMSAEERPHENKYIRKMASKLENKNWVTQWMRFMIRTLVDDKGMRGIEEAIDASVEIEWSDAMKTKFSGGGVTLGSAHKLGEPSGLRMKIRGFLLDETPGYVRLSTELVPAGMERKLEKLAMELSGLPAPREYSGILDSHTDAMMEVREFREAVFEIAAIKSTIQALEVFMHELSHNVYDPKIDGSEYLHIPRFGKDGTYHQGSWDAEITATDHTITCLKQVAKNINKFQTRILNLLGKSKEVKNTPKVLAAVVQQFDEVSIIIAESIRYQQDYAAEAFRAAKRGGIHPRDTAFNPENLPALNFSDGAVFRDIEFKNIATDELYSCRDLLEVDEEMKDEIHAVLTNILDLGKRDWPKIIKDSVSTDKIKIRIRNYLTHRTTYKGQTFEESVFVKYLDCVFKKIKKMFNQLNKLEEQNKVNKIFESYFNENRQLLREIVPPDEIEDYVDVEDLPENERMRVYSAIFNSGQELTDQEEQEFLDMIRLKKDRNEDLSDIEKKFVLSKIDAGNMAS